MKVAFTVATANYLSQAKTVADSFVAHNPEYNFKIFLLDKIDNRFDATYFFPAEIIEIEQLKIESFEKMLFSYSIFELSNALKPFVAEYILKGNMEIESVLYFDCDIKIYGPFAEVEKLISTHNILITPHFKTPLPLDGLSLDEQSFLNSGIYNGGFFVLKQCDETFRFLQWWKDRLENYCFVDFASGLFVDQIWLNLVPLYFKGVHILEDQGYNFAYWNLHERNLTFESDRYLVNDTVPLSFFHFSGYDFRKPSILSKYQTRYSFDARKDVVDLFHQYQQDVINNNFEYFSTLTCYYTSVKKSNFKIKRIKFHLISMKRYQKRIKGKLRSIIKNFL